MNKIWIIIEYCDCGSILDLMRITKKTLKERIIPSEILFYTKIFVILHPVWNRYQKTKTKI